MNRSSLGHLARYVVPVVFAAWSQQSLAQKSAVLAADDFTRYKTTADLQRRISKYIGGTGTGDVLYTDGRNAQLASIDDEVTYNGHHTLRYSQPGGTDASPELWVGIPKTSHVWFRVRIRFSHGWSTTGTGFTHGDNGQLVPSSDAYKLLGWNYSMVDGSGRIEISNTTEYMNYWGMNVKNSSAHAGGGNVAKAGQVAREWADGEWYTYIVEVDNTRPTGVTRLWIGKGDAKPALRASCTGTMDKGGLVPPVDAINFGMNYNQVRKPKQDQAIWYGDWEIVDGAKNADPFGVK